MESEAEIRRAYDLYQRNPARGLAEFRALAESGSARSMVYVGYAYEQGRGVKPDLPEAIRWYRRAAEAGWAPGMLQLGMAFEFGKALEVDLAEATRWYKQALQGGDKRAGVYLGGLLLKLKEFDEAQRVLSKKLLVDYPPAMYWLAKVYVDGGEHFDEARQLLEKASASGFLYAQAKLARLLLSGRLGWRGIISGCWLWVKGVALTLWECRRGDPRQNPRLRWW